MEIAEIYKICKYCAGKYVSFFKDEPVFLIRAVVEEDYYYTVINKNLELLFESCLGKFEIIGADNRFMRQLGKEEKEKLETNIKTKLVREISRFGNFFINTVKEALDAKQISKWQYDKDTWKVIDRMIKHPEKSIIWFTLDEK
jgi:hypothetical protein